ncbi:MAG: nucleotidyl transferase AbiEii/AbiGii toxin family protein, partial [Myxococcales bacterium]|nr:nucleotidyl transferase AbiEii/AbiGii toxin family protein [Myxococcales bacterium]
MSHRPESVIPQALAAVVAPLPCWFVIGGHAVRCFCPYRPSRDVDFGVGAPADLEALLAQLERGGTVELSERSADTVHLRWNGINVSIFVLASLKPHTEDRRLTVTGILATKLHAILDRGTRRDFFDLYVMLQHESLGIAECLAAMRTVYAQPINEPLLLRALTYFDDAEREAALSNEGPGDWETVKD